MGDYVTAVHQADTPPRIGFLHEFFADHADAETRQHTEATAQKLAQAGASVQEMTLPPSFSTVLAAQRLIMKVEMAAFHADMFMTKRDQYRPKIRESIESGLVIPGVDYLRAQRLRRLFQDDVSQMFQNLDVLLTPATPAPAPRDLNTTGDASFQAPWTYAGVPAIALPSGLSGGGMPLGIQLIAAQAQEDRLLRAARWCEAALEVSLAPPV
jgi:aspartyl-tRNA(Asn)/glutamyl-tRNA(Gln) amidotransferase subunit A